MVLHLEDRLDFSAVELPGALRVAGNRARTISMFVKCWVVADDETKAARIAAPVVGGTAREQAITAAVVHGMCVHYDYQPPSWVFEHRSPVPIHPVADRRLLSDIGRARMIMTASPVCRQHNVWFSESLVSARRDIRPPPLPPLFKPSQYASNVTTDEQPEEDRLLSKSDILALFQEIDAALTRSGIREPTRLVVAGGAAMCFLSDDRSTYDVDALNPTLVPHLQHASDQVASVNKLPSDWLNTNASDYADLNNPAFSDQTLYSGQVLLVVAPDNECLLAMKLLSARDKDLSDAAWLARNLNLRDRRSLRRVVLEIYGHMPRFALGVEWANGYIENVLDEIQMQEQLETHQQSTPLKKHR